MTQFLGSILIAAHNEETVIRRTLRPLSHLADGGTVDVIVVCNGCQDRTAEVAREFPGVLVRELTQASKTAALRDAESVARPGPLLYLDADVELTARAAVDTLAALGKDVLAGRPPHRFDSSRASKVVQRWYAVRERLPSIARTLWGAGCYGLSEAGRARFGEFPEVIADDLFVDTLFGTDEVTIIATDPVVVRTPRECADLIRIMRRSYRTQQVHGAHATTPLRISVGQRRQLRDLGMLLRADPARIFDIATYSALIMWGRFRAQVSQAPRWERDLSSRRED